jgi:AcrR family transcriptional regulator
MTEGSGSHSSAASLAQREYERMLAAVAGLAASEGFAGLTITTIRREAGVSRGSFDARFASASECFLVAVKALAHSALARAVGGADRNHNQHSYLHQIVLGLCAEADQGEAHARLVFVEVLAAGADGLICRDRLIGEAAAQLHARRLGDPGSSAVDMDASVGAAWRAAELVVAAGPPSQLITLAPLLTHVISPGAGSFLAERALPSPGYILKTGAAGSASGALAQAPSARPITRRVSSGSITPSSQIRAVE